MEWKFAGSLTHAITTTQAGQMVSQLPVRQLRASLGEHEPPGSTTNSSATDISTNGHVDPQQLDWDQSFWQTQSGSQEDGHDLTNVGRDQVTDELLHVVVNGTTFLNSGNNGGEVIISQHHLSGGLGDGGTGTHGNTNFGLLQGRGVVDTITSHSGDFVHALQELHNLRLVGGLDTREQTGTGASFTLLRHGQIVEFATRVRLAGGIFILSEHTNTTADSFSGGLVVTSDDNDTDTGSAATSDRVQDFLTRGVQHTDDTDEELGRIVQIHIVRLHRAVGGGQSQATEGIATSTVLAGQVQDALLQGRGQRNLGSSDASMGTTFQHTFRSALAEQLRSVAQLGGLQRGTVGRHGFTITGELQGEFLLPLGLNFLTHADGARAAVQTLLGNVEGVQLLSQHNQSGFGGLTDLLKDLLHFVEINSGVVTHDTDRSEFVQCFVVGGLDALSVEGNLTDRFVGRAGDFEFSEAAVIALNLLKDEHTRDGHLVGGQRTGLIRADDRGTTQGFDGRQRADNSVLLGHTAGTQGQTGGDDSGQTLRNGSDGQCDGDLEVVHGTLDPGATVGGIVEVTDVDGPDSDANQRDNLRQLLTELIQLLLQRGLDFLGFRHLGTDLTDGSVQTSADDNTACLTGGDVGTGEQNVLLVLVDSARVRDGIGVLDHGHGLTSQDGLIDTDGGGEDLDQTDISRDLVPDRHLNHITRDDLLGADLLHTRLVATDNLAHLGLVLLQRLNSRFGIAFLPHTDDGVSDQNQQNDERFNESFNTFMFLK
uniref:Uncharacterized protein n=1 Tax=Anopheles minimus TaxID=112268 RepID=A0A182WLP1_9DIPT